MNKSIDNNIKIGLEIHVQLNTQTKLFCSCPNNEPKEPNTNICDVCLGFPGSKPTLNKEAVKLAVQFALFCNCQINKEFFFSRKTYFYPDMSKNYQITQYEKPIAEKGWLQLENGKKIRIRRIHLEEDPASLIHPSGMKTSSFVYIDYNRAGVPLIEIVTEPDLSSPEEAKEFISLLETYLSYTRTKKKKGVIKADLNISVRGGNRTETKNVVGKKEIEKAIEYEIKRQLSSQEKIVQETRLWNSDLGITEFSRSKESEEDYGYIFESDLPVYNLTQEYLSQIKESLPETPRQKEKKFISLGIEKLFAKILSSHLKLAELFENLSQIDAVLASKLIVRDILGILNYNNLDIDSVDLNPENLSPLLSLIKERKVSDKNTKKALIEYFLNNTKPVDFLKENNLLIESIDLKPEIEKALNSNQKIVDDYKKGNKKAFNSLMGLIMRQLKGKADPLKLKTELLQILEKK